MAEFTDGLAYPFVIQHGVVYLNQAFIGDAYITTAKIADASITTAKIQDAAINNAKIGNAQITTAKFADGSITNAKIGTAQITTANILDGSINNAKIGNAQIDKLKLGANAVTTQAAYTFGPSPGSVNYVGRGGLAFVLVKNLSGITATYMVNGVGISVPGNDVNFELVPMAVGNNAVSNDSNVGKIVIFEAYR